LFILESRLEYRDAILPFLSYRVGNNFFLFCQKCCFWILPFLRLAVITWSWFYDIIGIKKGKVFPYSLPSVGPGADPGVQAVSPWVTLNHQPGGRLPLLFARPAVTFQLKSITTHWPVPNYTAWCQRHLGVNNY